MQALRNPSIPRRLISRRWHNGLTPPPPLSSSISLPSSTRLLTSAKPTPQTPSPSNPPLSFPCLDRLESRTAQLKSVRSSSGPEPSYVTGATKTFHSSSPLHLDYGGILPEYHLAYETWGELNADKLNAILLFTGLSASSHAKSNEMNPATGWWEKFIGPGKTLDTDRYFVVCANVLGGCYGSTGPSSKDPSDGLPYATRFPIVTMGDMVRSQFKLLDALGVRKLYASVGASMGGMLSLASARMFPERVGKLVSISACARSHPYSIALRHTQRQVLMADPAWKRGFYYDSIPPHTGMKLARQIATITYRSGPEWEQRFGRSRADPSRLPALCPDFLIETYLDHAGEKWCLNYDANSLLYVSKAMDLFDLGEAYNEDIKRFSAGGENARCGLEMPDEPIQEVPRDEAFPVEGVAEDLVKGLKSAKNVPTLVVGVQSDILFPAWQQKEIAEALRKAGNRNVEHVELGEDTSLFGHDTFLLDVENVGGSVAQFLSKP